ncbi:MAG TPA: ATP-binding cassette domain-containing protein [Gammaproteobacteria bacterium]|nr:ATP-binding cassette domain-containing protein [Gammaproteobacteria bacterium]
MNTVPALEFYQVSHVMDGRQVLDDINWIIEQGQHWAILGPNGAGKTTLLKMACGYLWANRGGVVLRKGKALVNLPELRKSIGWVTSALVREIPVCEQTLKTVVSGKFAQIGLTGGPSATPDSDDYDRAEHYLAEMGCQSLRHQAFGTLSQGEQQKVLIARARMTRPYLVFLDEPCTGMDPGARENFLTSISKLGEQEQVPALVYVTHHVEEILPLFSKLLILKGGRVLIQGGTDELLQPQLLEDLYQTPLHLLHKAGRYWPYINE